MTMTRKWLGIAMAIALAAPMSAAFANQNDFMSPAPAVSSAQAHYDDGTAALESGAYEEAIGHFQAVLAQAPTNADALNNIGYANRQLQNYDTAFEFYKRALAIRPDHTGAHHYIGEAYLEVGDLEQAEYHLQRLETICVDGCDDFDQLEQAVELFRANSTS